MAIQRDGGESLDQSAGGTLFFLLKSKAPGKAFFNERLQKS
jgi:hypothetical protein